MAQTLWREPLELSAGDTLSFSRRLSAYRASAGWQLVYELRGGAQPIEIASTPSGDDHVILVTAAITATWLPADYVLAGFAVNAITGERHQIYFADFPLHENLQTAPGNEDKRTHARKMLDQIEVVMLARAGNQIALSAIGETHFKYKTDKELREEHGYWSTVVRQEIGKLNAKNGRPTGNKVRSRFNIVTPGPVVGQSQFPNGYLGW